VASLLKGLGARCSVLAGDVAPGTVGRSPIAIAAGGGAGAQELDLAAAHRP
jgi:hypothetical protein